MRPRGDNSRATSPREREREQCCEPLSLNFSKGRDCSLLPPHHFRIIVHLVRREVTSGTFSPRRVIVIPLNYRLSKVRNGANDADGKAPGGEKYARRLNSRDISPLYFSRRLIATG